MTPVVRVFVIALSYLAASLGAGCALSLWVFFEIRLSSSELFHIPESHDLKGLIAMIAVSSQFTAVLGLAPALPAIVYSERRRVRSFWSYAYGGALIGLLSYVLYFAVLTLPEPTQALQVLRHSFAFPGWGIWLLTPFSGFSGGIVYWLVAGRNAGIQRASAITQSSS